MRTGSTRSSKSDRWIDRVGPKSATFPFTTVFDRRHLAALALVIVALLGACGADDEDEDTASEPATTASAQPTASTPAPTTPAKPKGTAKPPTPATPAPTGCVRDPRFAGLKFSGVPCAQAYAIAAAWDKMGDACNTVDDPESPEGYKRTCEVAGYTCNAKRVTTSEARKVDCASGSASIRFTWQP